jgi:flagellar biosynthetic protein FliR
MLEDLTALTVFHFFLLFCRLASAVMILPGIGEFTILPRARLMVGLSLSLAFFPMLLEKLPAIPADFLSTFLLIVGEIIIGLFIGGLARIIHSVLHIGGMIIAFQSSLASALLFDATQGSQGSVFGNFLNILGLTLLLSTNLHYIMIQGLVESYTLFTPGMAPPVADFAAAAPRMLAQSFVVAVKIASPMIVVGLLLYLSAGMMSRLMPNMQVFFIMIPLQIVASFYVLSLTLSATMVWYLRHFEESFSELFL